MEKFVDVESHRMLMCTWQFTFHLLRIFAFETDHRFGFDFDGGFYILPFSRVVFVDNRSLLTFRRAFNQHFWFYWNGVILDQSGGTLRRIVTCTETDVARRLSTFEGFPLFFGRRCR